VEYRIARFYFGVVKIRVAYLFLRDRARVLYIFIFPNLFNLVVSVALVEGIFTQQRIVGDNAVVDQNSRIRFPLREQLPLFDLFREQPVVAAERHGDVQYCEQYNSQIVVETHPVVFEK